MRGGCLQICAEPWDLTDVTVEAAVDSLDQKLIDLLTQRGFQRSKTLALELEISPSTVRRRIRNLIENGTLCITVLLDPDKTGFPLMAAFLLQVKHGEVNSVAKTLRAHPRAKFVSIMSGRYNLLTIMWFCTVKEMLGFAERDVLIWRG